MPAKQSEAKSEVRAPKHDHSVDRRHHQRNVKKKEEVQESLKKEQRYDVDESGRGFEVNS